VIVLNQHIKQTINVFSGNSHAPGDYPLVNMGGSTGGDYSELATRSYDNRYKVHD
jgi:hypothetical protein